MIGSDLIDRGFFTKSKFFEEQRQIYSSWDKKCFIGLTPGLESVEV